MPSPSVEQPMDDYEAQILNEVLSFWKNIPNSRLQQLADNGDVKKAIKLWEKRAKAFYHRFSSPPPNSDYQVVWNKAYWKYFRSVLVLDRSGNSFLFPKMYFQCQGIKRTFYDQFWKRWQAESSKSLRKSHDIVRSLYRELLADFNKEELDCLKNAIKSVEDRGTQSLSWLTVKYFVEKTGIPPNRLTKIFQRLYGYGIIQTRTYVNFAKVGLKPNFFISDRNLEGLEQDYCFFQVKSPESQIKFSAIAIPPVAIRIGWHNDVKNEGTVEPINIFCLGWNLSRLTPAGWGDFQSFHSEPVKSAFAQINLDFKTTPIRLRPSDPIYLERIQPLSPRELRAEFGVSSQQRLRDLSHRSVIQSIPSFRYIQCGAMIFLYCRGASNELEIIASVSQRFPRFRILQGEKWILMALTLPPSWVHPSLIALKKLASSLSIEDLLIDVHQGSAERYLPFSNLWDQEKKEWIA